MRHPLKGVNMLNVTDTHFSLDLRMSKTSTTTMRISTADRKALRDHLTSEFHRWVEDMLSRDVLPLGSAVPAMKHPQPRRGNKTKTKAKAKTKAQMKTSREEDQASAPAAPAPEDRRPAPAAPSPEEDLPEDGWKTAKARRNKRRRQSQDTSQTEPQPGKHSRAATTTPRTSTTTTTTKSRSRQCHNCQGFGHSTRSCTNQAICAQCSGTHPSIDCVSQRQDGIPPSYYCDLCMEEGHGRRSRFCKNRPRPAPKAKPTPPQDAEDTMDVSPATSDAATQADIPLFTDLQAFQPHTGNDDYKRERQWFEDTDPVALNLLPADAECEVQVIQPFFDAKIVLLQALKNVNAVHICPPDKCGSREHLYRVPARSFHALYASMLKAHDDFRATRPKHPQPVAVVLQSILSQGKSHPMTNRSSTRYPKIDG